jgi:hypothetical protein
MSLEGIERDVGAKLNARFNTSNFGGTGQRDTQ